MTFSPVKIAQPPVCDKCGKTVWTPTAPPNAPAAAFCQCEDGDRLIDNVLANIALRISWAKVQSVNHGDRTEFLEEMRRLAREVKNG